MEQSSPPTSDLIRNGSQIILLQTFFSRTNEKIMGVAFLMMAFVGEFLPTFVGTYYVQCGSKSCVVIVVVVVETKALTLPKA
jgi:hypothetical protein